MTQDETININARYYIERVWNGADGKCFNVIDRAKELRGDPVRIIFMNGTSEQECRDWITRNCEEPEEHTKGEWTVARYDNYEGFSIWADGAGCIAERWWPTPVTDIPIKANAALIATAPKLLALLEKYHDAMPTRESGALIAEARGWT